MYGIDRARSKPAGHGAPRRRSRQDSASAPRPSRLPSPMTVRHPLRPQSHRHAAHRRRAHGAVLLALRAPPRRHVHPARRGHRPRAFDPRGACRRSSTACSGSGLDHDEGPFYQTAALSTATARSSSSCSREGKAYHCYCTQGRTRRDARRSRWRARRSRATTGAAATARSRVPGVEPVVRFRNPDRRARWSSTTWCTARSCSRTANSTT